MKRCDMIKCKVFTGQTPQIVEDGINHFFNTGVIVKFMSQSSVIKTNGNVVYIVTIFYVEA